jgi:hypothetical protein
MQTREHGDLERDALDSIMFHTTPREWLELTDAR